jgi:hypothetical protein
MTGSQYEQFVRAVLAKKLAVSPDDLRSGRIPGTTLPSGTPVQHQVDLLLTERGPIADYVTVIECKYRSSAPVDQEEVAKLAYVKGSMKASKAILVTNTEFTRGAVAVADAEKIALLVIRPNIDEDALLAVSPSVDTGALFQAMDQLLSAGKKSCDVVVVRRFRSDPRDGRDIFESLAQDPEVRILAERAIRDPRVRGEVERVVRENPDLARKAMDFLKRGRPF